MNGLAWIALGVVLSAWGGSALTKVFVETEKTVSRVARCSRETGVSLKLVWTIVSLSVAFHAGLLFMGLRILYWRAL